MTPKKKTATSTSLAMERKRQQSSAGRKTSYVAGGEHQGIVINKVPQKTDIIRSFLKVPTTILDRHLAFLGLFA